MQASSEHKGGDIWRLTETTKEKFYLWRLIEATIATMASKMEHPWMTMDRGRLWIVDD